MIEILKTRNEINNYRKGYQSQTVGFVPTMGMLHSGHIELIKQSKRENTITIVSIFVNPTQFNNLNDFKTYPKNFESDLEILKKLNVDAVFIPSESELYPNGYSYKLTETVDSIELCGGSRPGHFDGVLTVLIKLFNLISPNNVYMGLKDYQQYKLVKNMAKDLFLDVNVHGVETVRESSGLAMSSRNINLSPEQKKIAEQYAQIFTKDISLEKMRLELEKLDLKIDYLVEKWGRKFIAVYVGAVRLIDNRPIQGEGNHTSIINNLETPFVDNKQHSTDQVRLKRILFKMSGSIASYKACDVISKLIQAGYEVRIAATQDVFQFIGKATLEGLTGSVVYHDIYQEGEMMSHIHLNDWCDITVLCPATANTLTKISLGFCDNIVTGLALSADVQKPYIVFPAMNSRMMNSQPIQEALGKINLSGKKIVLGSPGHLACGHIGEGRLAEVNEIINAIENELNKIDEKSKKVQIKNHFNNRRKILITAGGTSEPIDPVRSITNISTGATGLKIAEHLSKKFDVILLGSDSLKEKIQYLKFIDKFESFKSFSDLESKIKNILSENSFEAVIHLAAVSDYSPDLLHASGQSIELPTNYKISSSEDFSIKFKKNKKLISELKGFSINKDIRVIGFKLIRTDDQAKIQAEIDKVLKDSECVVMNSVDKINEKNHEYEIYNLSGLMFHGNTKEGMAKDILSILEGEV